MGRAASLLAPALAAVACATSGCLEQRLQIVTNETGAPVRVRYALRTFRADPDAPPICPLVATPPTVRPISALEAPPDRWTVVPNLSLDVEACVADYVLEPGFAALVYLNGSCDDHERYADQGAAYRPSLDFLRVERRDGTSEWRGWDTAEQFKAGGGRCVLRLQ